MKFKEIPEYWDIHGHITRDSCPDKEFDLYERCFKRGDDEGLDLRDDFTLKDFEDYISFLKTNMKFKDFTSGEKEKFSWKIYNLLCSIEERGNEIGLPWATPWLYAGNEEAEGDSIVEMAINYWEKNKKEILEFIE